MSKRRGTVTFEAAGKSYQLRFGMNQMAQAEDVFGMPFGEIIDRIQVDDGKKVRFGDLRGLFAVALGVKPEAAGDLMDEIGTARATELLGECIRAAFPDEEGGDAGNGKAQKPT